MNGEFELPVNANEKFSIYAYTYKDDYQAEYEGPLLGPIAIGDILDDRT